MDMARAVVHAKPEFLRARAREISEVAPFLPAPPLIPWSEDPRIFVDRSRPWMVVPAERDPLRTAKGGVVIPRDASAQLHRVARTGARFDRIAIAHELAAGALPSEFTTVVGPAGMTCDDDAAAALVGTKAPAPQRLVRRARRLDRLVECLANGTTTAIGGAVGSLVDPIVFGVAAACGDPEPGETVLFFPLAAWK